MNGSMICPTCKGNGFVWVETPEPKKDRWATDCTACNNQGEIPITDETIWNTIQFIGGKQ
jgi:DnaJ-class molecular chaperone